MKLINGLYNYLSSHQPTRHDPYHDKRRSWSPVCIQLWRWLFKERIAAEIQVARLTILLKRAEEKSMRTVRMLINTERQGELSFYEALQVAGVISEDAGTDAYARFYDESKRDYSNPFADMPDADFLLLYGPSSNYLKTQ